MIEWVYLQTETTYIGCSRCRRPLPVPEPNVPANGSCSCGGLISNVPKERPCAETHSS